MKMESNILLIGDVGEYSFQSGNASGGSDEALTEASRFNIMWV